MAMVREYEVGIERFAHIRGAIRQALYVHTGCSPEMSRVPAHQKSAKVYACSS